MVQGVNGHNEMIPISLVAHQVFCPRRAWLEASGENVDSHQMAIGTSTHAHVDQAETRSGESLRRITVSAPNLGVSGRCDVVQQDDDGALTVIEYKATPVRRRAEVTPAMRMQLALQGMALAEQGERVISHRVWFTTHRTYVDVDISDVDRIAAAQAVSDTLATVQAESAPAPLIDDPKCLRCSHVGVCLPDERKLEPVRRRINVADPDSQVLHLSTPGARASLKQGRLVVSHKGEEIASVPMERIQALVVHGNTDLSSGLVRELMWRGLTTIWCSGRGSVIGWANSAKSPNGQSRVMQQSMSGKGRLDIARQMIFAKVSNQATMIRRNTGESTVAANMRDKAKSVLDAQSLQEVFGIEGEAATHYFAHFSSMLKSDWAEFSGRFGRGATDPVNVALNLAYGVLTAECIRAIVACGLDSHAGFLHSSNRNKPALALDLCEEFRPVIADSAVVRAFNNKEIGAKDFSTVLFDTRLRDNGRKAIVAAVQRRLATKFTHPLFGYEVTWRRAIEIQARLVLGVIDGSQSSYVGVRVR